MNPSFRTSQQLMEAVSPIKEQLYNQTLAVEMRLASETSPPRVTRNNFNDSIQEQQDIFFKTGPQKRDSSLVRPSKVTAWDVMTLQDTLNKKIEDQE